MAAHPGVHCVDRSLAVGPSPRVSGKLLSAICEKQEGWTAIDHVSVDTAEIMIAGGLTASNDKAALPGLTTLEREVVRLSLTDARASLDEPTALMRLARVAFGIRVATRLANERLEAIRAYAIRYRIGCGPLGAVNDAIDSTAHLDGFATCEIRRLVDAALSDRSQRRSGIPFLIGSVLALAPAYFGFTLAMEQTGDALVSLMLVGLLAVLGLALALPKAALR